MSGIVDRLGGGRETKEEKGSTSGKKGEKDIEREAREDKKNQGDVDAFSPVTVFFLRSN